MGTDVQQTAPDRRADERAHDERARREIIGGLLRLTAHLNEAIHGHEFTANSEVIALVSLRVSGPLRVRDITERTGMTRAGTTGLVDRLERSALVVRTPADDDHRGVVVDLTPDGKKSVDDLADRITSVFVDAAPELSGWAPHFHALGIDVGTLRLQAGTARDRLDDLRNLALAGAGFTPLYAQALGPDTPHPHLVLHLLLLADEPGGTRPSALAREARLKSASTSDVLRHAERLGLVRRRRGGAPDRRATVVTVTDRGRTALDHILDRSDDTLRHVAGVLFDRRT